MPAGNEESSKELSIASVETEIKSMAVHEIRKKFLPLVPNTTVLRKFL